MSWKVLNQIRITHGSFNMFRLENIRTMSTLDFKSQNFQIPNSDRQLKLKEINQHPKDKDIEFDSVSHTYLVNKKPIQNSVTQIVDQYFNKFDADTVIAAMQNGPNWPRPEYTWRGEPLTAEQIKKKWDDVGTYARNRGTWMHYNIETYLNGEEIGGPLDATLISELNQLYDFEKKELIPNNIKPFRTEWSIGSESLNLAGTVDFVGRLPGADGKYVIIDWKRSPKLSSNMTNTWKNAKYSLIPYSPSSYSFRPPLNHLQDCDGMKYSLQLNIYK
jgi:hypothetical protein